MKKVISVKDIEDLLKARKDLSSLPADAIYTPLALDKLRELKSPLVNTIVSSKDSSEKSISEPKQVSGSSGSAEALFNSAKVNEYKNQICDIGRRLWQREYVDGNGGNISIRIDNEHVLCTPTLISKGFMKPEDLCLVDMDGNQLAGKRKRTSEILMHLAIMKKQPKAKSVVHCHPPYATAFAVAGLRPPTCMIPEIEVFIGEVPIAPYSTPGTSELSEKVSALADMHNTILMANHGVVSWSDNVEDAYFKMEIIEAYCRTIVVALQLGGELKAFSPQQLKELLQIKQRLGIPDPRYDLKECQLCDNDGWLQSGKCSVSSKANIAQNNSEEEQLVQTITDMIISKFNG